MIASLEVFARAEAVELDAVAFLGRDLQHRRTDGGEVTRGGGAS